MFRRPLPAQKYLSECFHYQPADGTLTWKVRPSEHFTSVGRAAAWNVSKAHCTAGFLDKDGYLAVTLMGARFPAHRVIWKLLYNEEPVEIDHIDLDRSNNRQANLRVASSAQNKLNRIRYRNNKSGFKGVFRHGSRWRSQIRILNEVHSLGVFATPEEAHKSYCAAAAKLHGEFARVS